MLPDYFYSVNIFSVAFRLALALVLSGAIGINRLEINRPAGLRTHVLVCLGTTLAMITAQKLAESYSGISDPARMGAQILSGIGFLGAGTILITGRQVKGLTTAAGLWATAAMGMALGIGFYSAALIGSGFIFFTLVVLRKLSKFYKGRAHVMQLEVEFANENGIKDFFAHLKSRGVHVMEAEWSDNDRFFKGGRSLTVVLSLPGHIRHRELLEELGENESVLYLFEVS